MVMKALCDGWQQAITVNENLIRRGEYANARKNLEGITRFVRLFATPEAIAELSQGQKRELTALQRHLATAWGSLNQAAQRIEAEASLVN